MLAVLSHRFGSTIRVHHLPRSAATSVSAHLLDCEQSLRFAARTAMSTVNTTQRHYENHNKESYESAFFYEEGAYADYLCSLVQKRLKIPTAEGSVTSAPYTTSATRPDVPHFVTRVLLDVGGGTGNFTRLLVQNVEPTGTSDPIRAVVVDPFLVEEASDQANLDSPPKISFVKASAEEFIDVGDAASTRTDQSRGWKSGFHQVLLKEVVHHFNDIDRVPIFRGIYNGLEPPLQESHPSLLIITRPQHEIDYPLWDEARQVFAANQPSLTLLSSELESAGFINIQHSLERYPCRVPLIKWQSMIRNRFWSTFAAFSDEELNEACRILEHSEKHRTDERGIIHFEDRLLFIVADKR
jgi:hypothetical protein